jgi:nucleotide-binding universal stress UspA family protein
MRSMLACTDGSPHAKAALQYARSWAERLGLHVKALFVEDLRLTRGPLVTGYYGPVGMAPTAAYPAFYDDLVKAVKEQGRRALDDAHQVFQGCPRPVEYIVREGLVHECILQEAKTVDLLCLGRRGEHGQWGGDDLGTTTQKVLHRMQGPVLTTPEEFHELTKLLVAYDGSKPANLALRTACTLASAARLPMAVVTVAPKGRETAAGEAALAEARQLAAAYEDVPSEFVLLEGDETETLLTKHAAAARCDLIVMGAYGHSRLREWLLGSITSAVLLRSSLPVLLVR